MQVLTIFRTTALICGRYLPIFYIQLDSIKHGLNPTFSFYTVCCFVCERATLLISGRFICQLAILNGGSVFGCIFPGFLTRQLGVFNMLLALAASNVVMNIAFLAVKTVPGVTIFSALYGFINGACELPPHLSLVLWLVDLLSITTLCVLHLITA